MIRTLLSEFWLQKLGWTLLHFLWQGTAILIVYVAARGILGRLLSARGRYLLACLALTAMTIAPPLTYLLLPNPAHTDSLPVLPWNISVDAWQQFSPCFVALWMAGVLIFSIRMLGGWRFTARLQSEALQAPPEWQTTLLGIAARMKTSRPVRLLISPVVAVPVVIGWLRPVILIPVSTLTGLPAEHIHALLAHELAHIRRNDYLANILQSVAEAALFYHPAVWWVSAQIRNERELCCDDMAVASSGDALVYASALARLESLQPSNLRTVLAANGGSVLNRVRRLIEPAHPIVNELPGAGAAWAMTLLWLAGLGVATVHAAQKPEVVPQIALIDSVAQPGRPSPFAEVPSQAVGRARKTLMFDPFLSAQLLAARAAGNAGGDGSPDSAPSFELADVRTSARPAARMVGGFYGDNRFDVQSAEMLDLISIAYGIDFEKVVGGPAWLETDRFDVSAIAPANSTPAAMRLMLRTLLAKRFSLVVHNNMRPQPTYALTALSKPQLKEAKGSDDGGCKLDFQKGMTAGPVPVLILTYTYTCRNTTMPAFAEQIRPLLGREPNPLLDETGLTGAWDFNLKFTFTAATRVTALFDALERQLGLKLEPRTGPAPVLVVDSVNRTPTDNAPGVAEKLMAAYPKEFEVADVRPSDPDSKSRGVAFQPGGRLTIHGVTLRAWIIIAWNLTTAEIAGGPKFLDTDRFDLIAKAPASAISDSTIGETSVNTNALRLMLRSLLADRFGLTVHTEDRPIRAFTLVAVKPKLAKADPANRTGFHSIPAPNDAINRAVACQNMTMADFAKDLPIIASGYFGDVSRTVVDATGLDGAWDFTLSFSGASTLQTDSGAATPAGQAPEPTGQVSVFDAIEKQLGLKLEVQKRSLPVLIVDHIEQKPTDN